MTHIRPDADGLGSQLALAEGFQQRGQRARVVIASNLPPRYRFLDPDRTLIEDFKLPGTEFDRCDGILILDTGTWNQLGEFGDYLRHRPVRKAVIDHHRTQNDLGAYAIIDTSAEATGRLAFEFLTALGVEITASMANHLLMALATDTGWFRHQNTSNKTFELAAELVRLGANPTWLYEHLYETSPLARLRLTGVVLGRIQTCFQGKVAYSEVFLTDYQQTGAVPGDTEELINYPRSVEGVEVALMFMEQPDGGTKISFRSRERVDVSKIAEQFGGGGHKLASGARDSRDLPSTRAAVLKVVEAAVVELR